MDEIFTVATGSHVNGSGQTLRLIWDIGMIGMCLYELFVKRRNGIILGLLIFAIGDFINAVYSVLDSLSLIFNQLYHWSSVINPVLRVWLIGVGIWISVIGRYLIAFYLWFEKPKGRKK